MSKYTTGEMAKLCDVSVRTVQYYDSRNILIPSELTEGGRRLYSEEDLKKLKVICFLRNIGVPINSIAELLEEENPGNVISILLAQQKQVLVDEIEERQAKLQTLEQLNKELKEVEHFSIESIGDIAYVMENKKGLRKVHGITIAVGVVMDIIEVATLVLWATKGIWWPFAIGMVFVVLMVIGIFRYAHKHLAYICPECHEVFRPGMKEMFFAAHTPKTRRLTCSKCGHKGFCVETYYSGEGSALKQE